MDTYSLVTFGLLELLKHHADGLNVNDLLNIFKAFQHLQSRPATIDIHMLPALRFGFNYSYVTETVVPLLKPDSQGVYTHSEGVRASYLAVFSSSLLENLPQAVDICALALENLRSADSGLLKRSCCSLLAIGSNQTLIDGLLRKNILPLYLEMLECEDERVVPYIMAGIAEIIYSATNSEPRQSLSNQLAVLNPLLSFNPFLDTAQRTSQGHSRLTIDTLKVVCVTTWLPRLEEMTSRIPLHVAASGNLRVLGMISQEQDYPIWEERCRALWTQLSQYPDIYDPPDWS
ncbi:hypothetical protein FRC12_024771 [Ceratobasidium sp. 428]|nr:hypothetical protein FRC12_024771 [Ceratobasidium sp. 428]